MLVSMIKKLAFQVKKLPIGITLKYSVQAVLLFVVSGSLFSSCRSSNDGFNQALPTDGETLTKIPARIQGEYLATDGASVLRFTDSTITRVFDFDVRSNVDSLPGGYRLKGDTLIILDMDGYVDKQLVGRVNDSTITYHEHMIDTLFAINDFSVLKKSKGAYYLNEKVQTGRTQFTWEVRKMTLQSGYLTISYIDEPNEINSAPAIAESDKDTITTTTRPAVKEFKAVTDDEPEPKSDSFVRYRYVPMH